MKRRKNKPPQNEWIIRKRTRRRKGIVKKRNIEREKRKIITYERESKNKFTKKVENVIIDAGTCLSLIDNPENVINVIERLDFHATKTKTLKNIQVNLDAIKKIDIAAISFLLAKVHQISKLKRINIWGNMPNDGECKKIFYESGFLDYMTDLSGKKFKKQSDNFFFKVGSDKTRNEKVGKAIESAMKFLIGTSIKYPPVYSIVQEICSNSVEWANPSNTRAKNWFMGVSLEKGENAVTFTMTDIGYGILKTLDRKFHKIIADAFLKDETEILKKAFDRKYGSKTREANRNRGLPLIKYRFEKRFISELRVITNNVFLDFENEKQSRVLQKNLPGTFYSWKINLKGLNEWNKIGSS